MSGYNIDRFLNLSESERDELTCSICQDILCCPVVSPCCLQMYCEGCIHDWLHTNNTCPQDRKPLTTSGLTRPPSCDYKDKGCKEVVKLEHLTQHTIKYVSHVTSESSKYYPKFREKLVDEFGDGWHVIAGKRYEYSSFYSYKKYYLQVVFDRLSITIYNSHPVITSGLYNPMLYNP
ncbi:unnamed protein product [Oppiella nova]|uniref:RING-type domain-containing protein n=1 Tax=Oppiella nova TaxID=334625 RepID=A0A7R9M9S6_9ACAR|nr:unnamed protein product [Oppiella nova]CAG2173369.1 unnamed protein product [Oppiella nova]